MKNIFIEGMQGAGKSTLQRELSKHFTDYKAYYEGDLSPVELAWCSYMTENQYEEAKLKYAPWKEEMDQWTMKEDDHYITAYTRIFTDHREFYEYMESFEIYNGRVDFETFQQIVMKRYQAFEGEGNIFECSLLQNSIENMMLYFLMSDDEIVSFYQKVYDILQKKNFKLFYLDSKNIRENILQIKKERTDDKGNELWFPLMMNYLKESPYGKVHKCENIDDLIEHFERRRNIELRVIDEVFGEDCMILKAKQYELQDAFSFIEK